MAQIRLHSVKLKNKPSLSHCRPVIPSSTPWSPTQEKNQSRPGCSLVERGYFRFHSSSKSVGTRLARKHRALFRRNTGGPLRSLAFSYSGLGGPRLLGHIAHRKQSSTGTPRSPAILKDKSRWEPSTIQRKKIFKKPLWPKCL
jgi:hypothetical protein